MHASPTIHLQPTAPLAERVLLPGDPARALMLAQALLEAPKMFNHNRGLWGYSGLAHDGRQLTIQSSAWAGRRPAIVVEELVMLGARRIVRVGTCGALEPGLALGEPLVAAGASAKTALRERSPAAARRRGSGAGGGARGSQRRSGGRRRVGGPVLRGEPGRRRRRALAVEMEAATLFALAAARGFAAGALLVVSDTFSSDGVRERITPERCATPRSAQGAPRRRRLPTSGQAFFWRPVFWRPVSRLF